MSLARGRSMRQEKVTLREPEPEPREWQERHPEAKRDRAIRG